MQNLNPEVTKLIEGQKHPLEDAISQLRLIILSTGKKLEENIKWNSPNYSIGGNDIITIRTQPKQQLSIIFHRGSKVQKQPKEPLIKDSEKLLVWKENDRAILTIKDKSDVIRFKSALEKYVAEWIIATQI